jgi:hypothetical protein
MYIRKLFAAAALTMSMVVPTVALAGEPTAPAACVFGGYQIASVTPYRVEERTGRALSFRRLRGAEIRVQAQPGLTVEWLQLTLQQRLQEAKRGDLHDCVLGTDVSRVEVSSAGTGFIVRLVAKDTKKADEVFRRASVLAGA